MKRKMVNNKIFTCAIMLTMIGKLFCFQTIDANETVAREDIVTSSELVVEGFQIKITENEDGANIGFRTICSGPKVGNSIMVGENQYKIVELGTILVLDPDVSGVAENKTLSKKYTILDGNSRKEESEFVSYTGVNQYEGVNPAYGFIATTNGFVEAFDDDDIENSYYVRTITDMNTQMANTIQARAFAVAEDGTIIYSEKSISASIAEVASVLYESRMCQSQEEHDKVYKHILNSDFLKQLLQSNEDYPFYRETEVDFDWSPLVPTSKD